MIMNLSCIICAELFSSVDEAYAITCGHIFHFHCLTQWLERSKTCPQCRNKCSARNINRLYFNIANSDTSVDHGALQHEVDNLTLKIRVSESSVKTLEEELNHLKENEKKHKRTIKTMQEKVQQQEFITSTCLEQIKSLKYECKYLEDLRKEIKELKAKLDTMATVESVINGTMNEVEDLLKNENNEKTLAVLVATLKRELRSSEGRRNDLRNVLKNAQNDLKKEQEIRRKLGDQISQIESENYKLLEEKKMLEKNLVSMEQFTENNINSPPSLLSHIKRKLVSPLKTNSPSLSEKVKVIQDSDSPYLKIKSSSVGLAPLLKLGPQNAGPSTTREKLSIFKKPRITDNKGAGLGNNYGFNGFGVSEKKENFQPFNFDGKIISNQSKLTSARLKSGRLKKN